MAADENEEVELMVVGKPVDDKKAVWDRWPGHPSNYGQPEGEVFISDMRPYEVDRSSPGIRQKLGEQALREISPRVAARRIEEHDAEQQKVAERREQLLETQRENAVLVPVPATVTPPVAQTPPPATQATTAPPDPDDDDEEPAQTGGATVRRSPRRPSTGGSSETPPER